MEQNDRSEGFWLQIRVSPRLVLALVALGWLLYRLLIIGRRPAQEVTGLPCK